MSTTTTTMIRTLQNVLDQALPGEFSDAARQAMLGTTLAPLKRTFTGLAGAATYNLTTLDASGETVGLANTNRLALLALRSLRITAATTGTVVGTYVLSDIAGAAVTAATHTVVGIALISDDGTTLTFPSADVTAFVIEYIPRTLQASAWTSAFAPLPTSD